jgi:hypothetical protein
MTNRPSTSTSQTDLIAEAVEDHKNELEKARQEAAAIRSYTNRLRTALKHLPQDIAYMRTSGRHHLAKDDLEEIIGAANEIATLLGMEI